MCLPIWRRALIASTGVFRRTIAFKAPARGQATVGFASISTSRAGRVSVPVSCPRGKRCTGTIALTGRVRVSAVGFDLTGGSKRVTLVVSKGRKPLKVRSFVGKDADKAKRVLGKKGLDVEVVDEKYSDDVAEGDVISQRSEEHTSEL